MVWVALSQRSVLAHMRLLSHRLGSSELAYHSLSAYRHLDEEDGLAQLCSG